MGKYNFILVIYFNSFNFLDYMETKENNVKMTQLKTLNDLDFTEFADEGGSEYVDPIPLLRAEAIKWIKELQPQRASESPFKNEGIINWIKYFFNITNEDISNG